MKTSLNKWILISSGVLGFLFQTSFSLPAFPGAQGYGSHTVGGRGGKVVTVTNLNAEGPGSFGEAMLMTEPRIIVFAVSGVIEGVQIKGLSEEHSFVTVAGQSSPGGITLRATSGTAMMSYQAGFHDAVFRYLRFRGDDNYDNISFNEVYNIVVDRCDFSGAGDETFDITHSHNFTVQWSTIANSGEGQTYGALIAYAPTSFVTLHHNLFAHHVHRGGPHFHWQGQNSGDTAFVQFVNNVSYDNENCRFLDATGDEGTSIWNFYGNYYKAGPTTDSDCSRDKGPANIPSEAVAFNADNYWIGKDGNASTSVLDLRYSDVQLVEKPFLMPYITSHTVAEALDTVLAGAGAWPRDAMNIRTVEEVRNGTGGLRKTDDALITTGPAAPTDTDKDGMPDAWETAKGLNPASAADAALDRNSDGYTNVEEYLNELSVQYTGPVSIEPGPTRNIARGPVVRYQKNSSGMEFMVEGYPSQEPGVFRIYNSAGELLAEGGPSHLWQWEPGMERSGSTGLLFLEWTSGDKHRAALKFLLE